MRLHFCTSLLLFCQVNLFAQHIELPDANHETVPTKGIYRFPAFTEGTIVLRSGLIVSQKLNYSISVDEMHFISQQGDTLAVANPLDINFISLNGARFYYDKGYLQSISITNNIILAFKQVLTATIQPKAAYNKTAGAEATKNDDFFTGNDQKYASGANEAVSVTAKEYYFFGDADGHFSKAGKEFLFQHFQKHQEEIKVFMKTSHTNFNRLEDLLLLTRYCSQLTP
jgi:hypothetical protein